MMETDEDQAARMDRLIARMAEIEAMQGQELPRREIVRLKIEHAQLGAVIADSESKRLRRKLAEYEHRDRVLDAFDKMERDDLKAFREKKHAVELAARKRL
jgi:hypothetical protein